MGKTELSKMICVTGRPGLYRYIGQIKSGFLLEKLADKVKTVVDPRHQIVSLGDISVFTNEGEVQLDKVLLSMNEVLKGEKAPNSKAVAEEFQVLFLKVLPNYDADRFCLSHMRKIANWYNELREYASFDFVSEKEQEASSGEQEELEKKDKMK